MIIFITVLFILLIMLLLALGGRVESSRFKALRAKGIAHRGLHKSPEIPENSLPAFALAVKQGYGIELDLHLLADGTVAVFHDDTLVRMTGKEGNIKDLREGDLKNYTLGEKGFCIPTFDEVLKLVDGKVPLIIELKTEKNTDALCKAVMRKLKEYKGHYCIESFDPRVLFWLRRNHPKVTRGQLSQDYIKNGNKIGLFSKLFLTSMVFNFLTRPDFIAYNFGQRKNIFNQICIKFWNIQPVHWTITNKEDYETSSKEGAIVIFENFLP